MVTQGSVTAVAAAVAVVAVGVSAPELLGNSDSFALELVRKASVVAMALLAAFLVAQALGEIRGRKPRPPVYATGNWRLGRTTATGEPRENPLIKRLRENHGWSITVLEQEDEGYKEAASVLQMLQQKGVAAAKTGSVLLVGSGKGSTQVVLARDGETIAMEAGPGYDPNSTPEAREEIRLREEAITRAVETMRGYDGTLELVVAWGACYYKCQEAGNPVSPDKKELAAPQPKEQFTGAGFQDALPGGTPMLVIRNVLCDGGANFKPFWLLPTEGTGKYVDLGSGKAALVNVENHGTQERNLTHTINPATSTDFDADAIAADKLLSELCSPDPAPAPAADEKKRS